MSSSTGLWHTDGSERKESYRPAATYGRRPPSATASLSSRSGASSSYVAFTCMSYKTHAMQHFVADSDRTKVAGRALILDQVVAESFGELRYCRLTSKDRMHTCIIEATPLMDPNSYSAACGVCPKSGTSVLQLSVRGNPRNIHDLESVRNEWKAKNQQLDEERADKMARRVSGSKEAIISVVENNSVLDQERDAWLQYTLVTFDLVRPRLIEHYARLYHRHVVQLTQVNLHAYEVFMTTYLMAFTTRTCVSSAGKGTKHGTPPMWCFLHDRMGHMFPVAKSTGYNPECWICISDNAPLAPKEDPNVMPGFADGKAFLSVCGKVSGGKSREQQQQNMDDIDDVEDEEGKKRR